MTQYDETNRFALFKNDRKEKDTHPDMTGTINVDGVEYYLNAWTKEGKKGKFLSGSIKLKEDKPAAPKSAPVADPFGDDLPF